MAEEPIETEGPLPEEASNRTFIILALALGGVLLLGLLCIGGYLVVIAPRQATARQTEVAVVSTNNAQVAAGETAAAIQALSSPTPTPAPPTATPTLVVPPTATHTQPPTATRMPTNTPTPVTVIQVTASPTPTGPTATGPTPTSATLAGATPTRIITRTPTQGGVTAARTATPTATGLPTTGFADEAGVPGLILLGVILIGVVILARRLRLSLR